LDGDTDKFKRISETKEVINKYFFFKSAVDLGINYGPKDLSFSQMMLFSWIKDGLSGRKN
jgi:hypothetical protein